MAKPTGCTHTEFYRPSLSHTPHHEPPSSSANTEGPKIWRPETGTLTNVGTLRAAGREQRLRGWASERWRFGPAPSLLRPEWHHGHVDTKYPMANITGLEDRRLPCTLWSRGTPEPLRQAYTRASGMYGPGRVVTTVTRTAQRTLSAAEIFGEVRDCVIEYLGSDVER